MDTTLIGTTAPSDRPPTAADLRQAVDRGRDDAPRLILEFNKHAFVQAMRAAGLASVEVTYSGYGDSGWIDEVEFEPADVDALTLRVLVAGMRYRWDEERFCGASELVFDERSLPDAAEALCALAITLCGHDGYENNDGGGGSFTLQAADASAVLEHRDDYTESIDSVHPL